MATSVESAVKALKIEFQHRYSYMTYEEINYIYNEALAYYLSLAFPFRHDLIDLPQSRIGDINKLRILMQNIIDRLGVSSYTAYSENGMSYEFNGTMFDDKITSMIVPEAKVIE